MRSPRRVLQVMPRSAGGIARHVAHLVSALDGRDALALDIAGPPALPVAMPKPVLPLSIPEGVRGHRPASARLRALLEEGPYDVVHAHGLRAGLDAASAARRLELPVLLTVHNLVRPEVAGRARAAVYRWAEPLAVRRATRTFAVSEDIARHLRRVAPDAASRVEVLYLGVGPSPAPRRRREEVRRELEVSAGDPLVVTASRLAPQKNLGVMLNGLSLLPEGVKLAVLGEGPLEAELRRSATELGVSGRVRWLGWRSDPASYISASDAFCLSSSWEGIPLAAQEAILLEVPVVASRVGGMPELIEDGKSGRLVPPGDPQALAAALHDVLFSPRRARAQATTAKERLNQRFSSQRMLERLADVYGEGVPVR